MSTGNPLTLDLEKVLWTTVPWPGSPKPDPRVLRLPGIMICWLPLFLGSCFPWFFPPVKFLFNATLAQMWNSVLLLISTGLSDFRFIVDLGVTRRGHKVLWSEKNVTFQIKPSTSRKSFQSHCYQKQSPRLVLLQVLHFFPLVLFFFCFISLPLSLFFFLAQITNTYKIPLYLRESALYAGWGFLGSNPGTATSRDMTLDKWLYLSPSVSSSVKWRRKEFISPKSSIDD